MPWDPRFSFLPDEDMDTLYAENPQMGSDPEKYCPTCQKQNYYVWQGERMSCDCQYQLALHKHYTNAGIGVTYQRLSWLDYHGDESAERLCGKYRDEASQFVARGLGLIFYGSFGTGKTMAMNLLLKDLVKQGYRCYGTTFANMIDMFTAGWRDAREQKRFHTKVKLSDVLLLDDVGKEMRSKSTLPESTFDSVLRSRCQNGRPTLITSNMTLEELGEGYGGAIFSLLKESSLAHQFVGHDYRERANARLRDELLRGQTRPIV